MKNFSHVYKKSVSIAHSAKFADSFQAQARDLKASLNADGPNVRGGPLLDNYRALLAKADATPGQSAADLILEACKPVDKKYTERVAYLKAMKHFYLAGQAGAQQVWVNDQPGKLGDWIYPEYAGKSELALKAALNDDTEFFKETYRNVMVEGLMLARKWSMDIQVKMTNPDEKTLAYIKRWFYNPDLVDEKSLLKTAERLQVAFKDIARFCNENKIVFSYVPVIPEANEGTVMGILRSDRMNVIYIFPLISKTVTVRKAGLMQGLWECALSIIHEVSHQVLYTSDKKYQWQGLKVPDNLTKRAALNNADSLAFFAADIVGALPSNKRLKAVGMR